MASAICNPIRVDMNTRNVERGRFAKICVEVDLDKPVVGKICTKDHWYNIEYEGLRIIWGIYGCYGRLGRACPMENVSEAVVPEAEIHVSESQAAEASVTVSSQSIVTDTMKSAGPSKVHGEWLIVT